MEGSAKMRAELTHALSDIDDPDRPTKKIGWFDWMEMDIEEHAARKRREKEQTVLDSLPKSMRVPRRNAPTFSSMLCSGILVTIHLLMVLMQIWSVKFNVWMNYDLVKLEDAETPEEWTELDETTNPLLRPLPAKDGQTPGGGGEEGAADLMRRIEHNNAHLSVPRSLPTHCVVTPSKEGERPLLLPLLYLPTLGVTFEYHRRRYYLDAESGSFEKVRCNTTMPLEFFGGWTGIEEDGQLEAAQIRFGPNKFEVRQPTFMEMYKLQLLSPFTVFQLFCVVLWMLDDYWQYSAFTLFMILTFEATVVYSRIRSLSALRGMGNADRRVMVYRLGEWRSVWTYDLLPGDVMSLTRHVSRKSKDDNAGGKDVDKKDKKKAVDEEGDVVPADVLLLRGSTVVNEASLTGESVPQMKEGLSELTDGTDLDMKTRHKTHVLYAGTRMLQCKGVEAVMEEEAAKNGSGGVHGKLYKDIPSPPDGGCLTFVLRTGFSSAQGKLVRMIEGSQEKVKGHEKETALLLLMLFFFAVASSSYVLYHGLRDEGRSQYELLLHCILIVTSVIPPELPMQMALAVNNSLMTLMKLQIFCTEPYRVPIAGKLDSCLFDKTGTLTTDELVPVGVLGAAKVGSYLAGLVEESAGNNGAASDGKESGSPETRLLAPMTRLPAEAALVLSGCHSLVLIDGETTGDPLESAAIKAMRWEVSDGSSKTSRVVPSAGTERKKPGSPFSVSGSSRPTDGVEVLTRHHFSSRLQRMSCVVRDVANRKHYAVVKGSPEMVGKLLAKKPKGYDEAATLLSRRGYRVISLAYRPLSTAKDVESAQDARSCCEEECTFAGFVAFTCRVRRDTKMVLTRLRQGGMGVAMVTGDALLTAIHVAKEVGICDPDGGDGGADGGVDPLMETNKELLAFLERKRAENSTAAEKEADAKKRKNGTKKSTSRPIAILERDGEKGLNLHWVDYDDGSTVCPYNASSVPELASKRDLAVTGSVLALAYEADDATRSVLEHFKVFARMTPDAKETVIECLHSVDRLCLMCGDGGE